MLSSSIHQRGTLPRPHQQRHRPVALAATAVVSVTRHRLGTMPVCRGSGSGRRRWELRRGLVIGSRFTGCAIGSAVREALTNGGGTHSLWSLDSARTGRSQGVRRTAERTMNMLGNSNSGRSWATARQRAETRNCRVVAARAPDRVIRPPRRPTMPPEHMSVCFGSSGPVRFRRLVRSNHPAVISVAAVKDGFCARSAAYL